MIKKKFKAAILSKINSDLKVKKIEIKTKLKGTSFCKIKYSGVCGKQIDEINGTGGKIIFFLIFLVMKEAVLLRRLAQELKR